MDFLKLLFERWTGPMPPFFRWIFWLAAAVTALAAGVQHLHADLVAYGLTPPDFLLKFDYWISGVAALVAKLTVDWKKKEKQDVFSNWPPLSKA